MITVDAEWTDDCQGKKDYDGSIVDISSRYWPRGGSFLLINRTPEGVTTSNSADPSRQHIRPSATSSIRLLYREEDESADVELIRADFEADTEEEVKQQVEQWAAQQLERVRRAVHYEFVGFRRG